MVAHVQGPSHHGSVIGIADPDKGGHAVEFGGTGHMNHGLHAGLGVFGVDNHKIHAVDTQALTVHGGTGGHEGA